MHNDDAREANGTGSLRRVADIVPSPLRPLARWCWSSLNRVKAKLRHPSASGRRHGLPGELIVSLTSYPARFPTLHLTLRCLLSQDVKPDRVILWIAHQDVARLPLSVLNLQRHGLEICACDDLRSYKKLVPALETFPDAFIVTADDDLYYPSNWLRVLVTDAESGRQIIVGRRVMRLVHDEEGHLARFNNWQWDVSDTAARQPSLDLMCETGAGALFPPRSLHEQVTNRELFASLCPDGDDLWFYWCSRMAGTLTKKAGSSLILTGWQGTQQTSLWLDNEPGGYDGMIRALEERFGAPLLDKTATRAE